MTINFDIKYTDEDGNYYFSENMPEYLIDVFSDFRDEPYRKFRNELPIETKYSYYYPISSETTLHDLLNPYLDKLKIKHEKFYKCSSMVWLKTERNYVNITDYDYYILRLIRYFGQTDELNLFLIFSVLQGDIWREDSIRYYMNSHEAGSHNFPHVHVLVERTYEASINLINGEIITGILPAKFKKKVLEKVKQNRLYLLDCWNKQTDGLKFDINFGLGITCDLPV